VEQPANLAGLARVDRPWPCWIEVDLDAIGANIEAFRRLMGPSSQFMAVVKAEAYGHGAAMVARTATEAGAAWLGVARVREGVLLREAGLSQPILVLGPVAPGEAAAVVEYDLRATIGSVAAAQELSSAAAARGRNVPLHVKLNTGLGRYGLSLEAALAALRGATSLPNLVLEGVYSHFATADDPDRSYAIGQIEAFHSMRSRLAAEGYVFPVAHIAASAGILALDESEFDMARIGISLYGAYPAGHLVSRIDLRPALSMHSRVARVFDLRPGESVGYGRTFIAADPAVAALVPVGYADGLPRSHSNRGEVLVNGCRAPLIGRVSMDQCVADVTACGSVAEGDPVAVIGSQGDHSITIDDFAGWSGTINYEALTSLGHRVPRVYRSGGRDAAVAYLNEGRLLQLPAASSGGAEL
jgi:alanine racemase